jgi:hypothetical protein
MTILFQSCLGVLSEISWRELLFKCDACRLCTLLAVHASHTYVAAAVLLDAIAPGPASFEPGAAACEELRSCCNVALLHTMCDILSHPCASPVWCLPSVQCCYTCAWTAGVLAGQAKATALWLINHCASVCVLNIVQ